MLSATATTVLAICVLGAMGLTLLVWAAVRVRRSLYTPAQAAIFAFNHVMARVLWRARVLGGISLPPGQGAVIISNHGGPIDPSFIALTVDRLVHWMVAKEYCQHWAFGWFMRICEVIPVNRGGIDTAATKLAIRYVREGGLIGIFLEGRINDTDQLLLPGRSGAAMIALKARAPVIPCYISGSPYDGTPWGCLFMPARVRLEVGSPIDISQYYGRESDREVLEHLTRRFLVEIARLAGVDDFQPELAGRFYKPDVADV